MIADSIPMARGLTTVPRAHTADRTRGEIETELLEMMNLYERKIYAYVLSLVGDADVAVDCSQDTFMRAYDLLRSGRDVNRQWLYKVARSRAMDEFRRRRRVRPDEESLEKIPVDEDIDLSLAVRQVMDQLPPLDRDVLYLFTVAGFRTDEIGSMLGYSGAAIRQRLTRARARFRELYGGTE